MQLRVAIGLALYMAQHTRRLDRKGLSGEVIKQCARGHGRLSSLVQGLRGVVPTFCITIHQGRRCIARVFVFFSCLDDSDFHDVMT